MGGVFSKKENKKKQFPGKPASMQPKICQDSQHYGVAQTCAQTHCKNEVCNNCRQPKQGKLYCMLCELSLADEEEIDFQEIEKSKIREAQQTVKVRQSETG